MCARSDGPAVRVSVVVPAYNAERTLARALEAVAAQLDERDELIVVDDGSTEHTAEIAAVIARARTIRLERNQGISASRNAGAAAARGEMLFFADADAMLGPGALDRAWRQLQADPGCAAVVGIYSADGGPDNTVSRVKNLWIRYTYLCAPQWIDWAFTCALAIRRSAFEAIDGFVPAAGVRWGGEDIELGLRLTRAGYRIRLDHGIETTHLRRHDVLSLLLNDFRRSAGYARLGWQALGWRALLRERRFANIDSRFLAGIPLVTGATALLWAAPMLPPLLLLVPPPLAAYLALNLPYYRYLVREGGPGLALSGAGLLAASQLVSLVGASLGVAGVLPRGEARAQRCSNRTSN